MPRLHMGKISNDLVSIKMKKLNKLSVPTTEGFEFIDSLDITYLVAEVNYTHIHLTTGKKITSSKNLGYYENELVHEPFIRIHNSSIINLNRVKSYIRGDDGWIVMQNGETLKVSKSKKDDLLFFFKGRSTK